MNSRETVGGSRSVSPVDRSVESSSFFFNGAKVPNPGIATLLPASDSDAMMSIKEAIADAPSL